MVDRRLNVLVLGVGGNVSQGIQKALALGSTPTRVVAACISAQSAGLYLADSAFISPLARAPEFIPWILEICEREQIDAVMSGSEVVLEAVAPEADLIQKSTGAVCIVSSPNVLKLGRDKLLTCRWLEAKGLPVPGYADPADPEAVSALVERCGFPLIAKPRLGKGSDGIVTIRTNPISHALSTPRTCHFSGSTSEIDARPRPPTSATNIDDTRQSASSANEVD